MAHEKSGSKAAPKSHAPAEPAEDPGLAELLRKRDEVYRQQAETSKEELKILEEREQVHAKQLKAARAARKAEE